MKLKTTLITLITVLFLMPSCKKMMEDVNTNPDQPSDVPINVRLSAIQVSLAYSYGGDLSRHSSIFTNQTVGAARQWLVFNNYGIKNEDLDYVWADNLYSNVLMELKLLKEEAEKNDYEHYLGVAKAIEAFTLITMTDLWNDIPYSEALQGIKNLQPAYDSQSQIYATAQRLLAEATAHLAATNGGAMTPGADDQIYNGDIESWEGFVSILKARIFLHLGEKDPTNYQKAIDEITVNGGIFYDACIKFEGGANASPWYQFNRDRGDIQISSMMNSLLTTNYDPRSSLLANIPFTTNHIFFREGQCVVLLSITEQKFILAECYFKLSNLQQAKTYYLFGIEQSLGNFGLASFYNAFITQNVINPPANALTLNHIMTQKYLALFTSPEVFTDMRRTGFPVITPNTGTQLPNRFPYPQKELDLNNNTPRGTSLFTKVWWQN